VALGLFAAGGAFAVDKFYKHRICGDLSTAVGSSATSTASSGGASDSTADLAEFRKQTAAMRRQADLLLFDGGLRTSMLGLTDDADRLASLESQARAGSDDQQAALLSQVVITMGSVDGHIRDAQRACGQPQTGIVPVKTA
jgi:hypothetical protein